ncbi:hypothetical protein L2E82_47785 [Cichorium intybus]|uniref:Uncharacterized protein n=1 Tax=Cichorium intybus TaxID=13427 RepID=A0ACB8Z0L5_CICIN|nr:hypothetical protein L2E82_47785 [Cichorium intybus]
MDQGGRAFVSALSVGIGIGVGLGVGRTVSRLTAGNDSSTNALTPQMMEREMLGMIMDGKDSKVTFYEFPYYLSEQTRVLLTSAAFVYLKNIDFSKHTRNLAPASRTILLSGPAELYQQMLAKALAHYFEAKLLLLDVTDFSLKIQNKYGASAKPSTLKRSISETTLAKMSGLFESVMQPKPERKGGLRRQSSVADFGSRGLEPLQNPPNLRRNASTAANMDQFASNYTPVTQAPLRRTSSWSFDEKLFVQTLYKVLTYTSNTSPIVLYLRDVEKVVGKSQRIYILFQKMLKKITGPILILGSQVVDHEQEYTVVDERITSVFPYTIDIKPPEEEDHLVSWKNQLQEDMKMIQFQDNRNHISEVLAQNDLECDDLGAICVADTIALSKYIEEVVVSAISHHLMNTQNPNYRNGKLVISAESLANGLSLFHEVRSGKDVAGTNTETKPQPAAAPAVVEAAAPTTADSAAAAPPAAAIAPEVPPDNEFERRIRPAVIPAHEIGVTFADIGALGEIKESLQELVMLPLRRPDLFIGGLLKPCRGILLFGPPGTGKTMLAKAIANEAGASFINVSMSTITSKWFGEDEKNVRALFTLAAKVSPTIIFVDEVDSMLGQRSKSGENEAMRKIKNEFMTHWDGLLSKSGEQILVLAATNRPFDLDEAIIRRFERRIMVGLPSVEQREIIFRTLLAKENVIEGLDFREIANMTEGFTGSDLKNLCTTAAYRPVRELIQQERQKDLEKKRKAESGDDSETPKEQRVITIRPLNMKDFRVAKTQVAASFAAEGSIMSELKQWNDQYGEGGSRRKTEQLTYFL